MRSLFLGIALVGALATSSFSADMPMKAVPSVPSVLETTTYNWTGLYIGAHVGGAWTSVDRFATNDATGAIDNRASSSASSFMGGGQVGYNWMFAHNWVLGIEADVSGLRLAPSDTSLNVGGGVPNRLVNHEEKADWVATLRGRLGYAWANWLLYGTGGVAWEHLSATRTQLSGTTSGATAGTSESITTTKTGYAVGGGLEWAFARNWTLRGEYLYLGFSGVSYSFPIAARTDNYSSMNISIARAALNYRF